MAEELTIRYDEKTGLWEKHEPFITIDVMSEEDYKAIKAAIEHYQKRGKWDQQGNYSECGKNVYDGLDADVWSRYSPPFCPNCGVRMEETDWIAETKKN